MRKLFIWAFGVAMYSMQAQPALHFEENRTPTYQQVIENYRYYDQNFGGGRLLELGPTDSGEPLHLFLIGQGLEQPDATLSELSRNKTVVLINNGIHPGESCGIDASLMLTDTLLRGDLPADVLIAIIPVYNVGGALNRNSNTRTNQVGPEEHGFRGNARNLDLNRDFIKADALNTKSFYAIFHALKPHIFVDTHTSNGADYQYTMTLISTQKDKLNPILSTYLEDELEPELYDRMKQHDWPMTPYVNVFGDVPNNGFRAFLETPRYASGYTALFNTLGFITETHMLKPYADRVLSTYAFLDIIQIHARENAATLKELKQEADKFDRSQGYFSTNWQVDSTVKETLQFKGYAYSIEDSKVHQGQRLRYDQSKPETFYVNYYSGYKATDSARVPEFYILPQAWRHVAERLQANDIEMQALNQDTLLTVEYYRVENPRFAQMPYEGHFPLQAAELKVSQQNLAFRKGDWLISTDQPGVRFLVNTLEPLAADSYLRWNFFDAIFQQKEHFSPYVFEDEAARLLKDDQELKTDFEQWMKDNPHLAAQAYSALNYLHRRSKHYESSHLRYPVYRIPSKKRPAE